ncbi:DUF4397 domain-containing protein [Halomarina halobia]|uniref:DUF4397 domain-containing protein n=2 Tax=Halomarina halobia TaxID=3033386 RepID=A0ABD6A5E0_9EURY
MTETNRRTVLKLLGVAGAASAIGGAGFVTAQQDGNETDSEVFPPGEDGIRTGGVRVGHLSPDTPPVDVYVGLDADFNPTDTSPAVSGLEFGNFAPSNRGRYFEVPVGVYALKVTPAGDPGTVVLDVPEFRVLSERDATVLAVGELSPEGDEQSLAVQVITDSEDASVPNPTSERAAVRFVHASPDAGEVDLVADDEPVAENGEFGDVSSYVLFDAGEQVLQVERADGPPLVLQTYLPSGTKSTLYVAGEATPEAAAGAANETNVTDDNVTDVTNDTNVTGDNATNVTNDTNLTDNATNLTNETNETNVANATNVTNDTNLTDNATNLTNETNVTDDNVTDVTNDTNVTGDNVTNDTNVTNATNATNGGAVDPAALATDDRPLTAVATIDAVAPPVVSVEVGGGVGADDGAPGDNVTNETNVTDDNVTDDNVTDVTNDTNVTGDNATNVTNDTNLTDNATNLTNDTNLTDNLTNNSS